MRAGRFSDPGDITANTPQMNRCHSQSLRAGRRRADYRGNRRPGIGGSNRPGLANKTWLDRLYIERSCQTGCCYGFGLFIVVMNRSCHIATGWKADGFRWKSRKHVVKLVDCVHDFAHGRCRWRSVISRLRPVWISRPCRRHPDHHSCRSTLLSG